MTHRSAARDAFKDAILRRQEPDIIVVSGPSGGGKSTQIRAMLKQDATREFLVSYTTRMPRPEEVQDREYHFLALDHLPAGKTSTTASASEIAAAIAAARQQFREMSDKGEVLFEHTEFYGNLYGTPHKQLEDGLANGKQMIADVNLEGLEKFKATYGKRVGSIFLSAEIPELRKRLTARDITPHLATLSEEEIAARQATIEQRMRQAQTILDQAHAEVGDAPAYDHIIITGATAPETTELVKTALGRASRNVTSFSSSHTLRQQQQQANAGTMQMC